MEKLLALIERCERTNSPYRLTVLRPEAVCVELHSPGEMWEVEFFSDGHIEIERYHSLGVMEGGEEAALDEWFRVEGLSYEEMTEELPKLHRHTAELLEASARWYREQAELHENRQNPPADA